MAKNTYSDSNRKNQSVPIAIIGIGCIFPKAHNLSEYWANIKEGVDAITEIPETHWRPEDYFSNDPKHPDMTYAKRGGFVPKIDFNPLEFGILPNAIEATDTSQLLSLVAAQEALKDAGYLNREFNKDRVSVILGVTGALELVIPLGARLGHPIWRRALKEAGLDDEITQDVVERIGQGYVEWQESSFPGLLGNVVAGRIANRFDLGGTNCAVDAACASSLSAIHLATMELESGRADMVLTGGVDTFNHIFMYVCFSKTPALSPSGRAKPFDHKSDGTALGEGVGVVALKRLEDAQRDGDRIYAVIKGMGSSSDGKGNSIYAPSADGQVSAYLKAYEDANVSPDSIELMEAHGTGTKVGDVEEIKSLLKVYNKFQANGSWCALGSVKSQIGHTKSAAGVAGLIKAAMALHTKVLPPTINVEKPASALEPGKTAFYVNTQKRPWVASEEHPRRAAISAFGFGGSNFHCVLEEHATGDEAVDWSGNTQILAFSAENIQKLQAAVDDIASGLSWAKLRSKALKLRQTFDSAQSHRLLMVVEHGKTVLAKLLKNAKTMLEKNQEKISWNTPDGIFFGRGATSGKLGIIFPGQGSQYVGMLRDLACQFPQFQSILETANRVFHHDQDASKSRRLSDLIYPHPTFTEEDRKKNAEVLQSTQIAQPAIGAVSLGLLKILEFFGVHPESVAGHSYGELVALCASGVLDTETFFAMSKLRGQLMGQRSGDKGSMLAVQGDVDSVNQLIQEGNIKLVIANKNSPNQTVLSGATGEIERAAKFLKERGVRCKQLNVAAAFHSSFVSDASGAFLEALKKVEMHQPRIPVYADSTAGLYPNDPERTRELLAGQLANPVDFLGIIENMYDSGVRTFFEVGPSSQMNGLIKAILERKDVDTFSVDTSSGKRSGETDLARALSQLAALGYDIRLSAWDDAAPVEDDSASTSKKRVLSVPINGANYFKPKSPKPPIRKASVNMPTNGAASKSQASEASQAASVNTVKERQPATSTQPVSVSQPKQQSAPTQSTNSTPQMKSTVQQSKSQPKPSMMSSSQSQLTQQPIQRAQVLKQQNLSGLSMDLSEALRMTQDNLRALQQFQQQTADLHRQFLEGQEATRQTFDHLFSQQQQLLSGGFSQETSQVQAQQPSADATTQHTPSIPVMPPAAPPVPEKNVITNETSQMIHTASVLPELQAVSAIDKQVKSASSASNNSQVEKILLEVVSEKTGYPEDMLDLGMGLDADLGIDSIKRVEILSALQEQLPNAPEISSDQIGSIQTLGQIVDMLATASFAQPASSPVNIQQQPVSTGLQAQEVESVLLKVVAEKTGYPEDMLDLDMGLDADLGIDSIKRVEILSALQEQLPNAPEISSDQIGTIQTLRQIVEFLGTAAPVQQSQTATSQQSSPSGADSKLVETVLLKVVSEKTGYPEDMLDLDMGLDADLGIDSIKRVEILSALQEQLPNAPEISSDQIGTIQNLRQIVDFLGVSVISSAQQPSSTGKAQEQSSGVDANQVKTVLLQVVSEKTGYPENMLDLDMGLDADLGIDSIKRVEILSALQNHLPNSPEISSEHIGQIQNLRQIVDFLSVSVVAPSKQKSSPVAVQQPVSVGLDAHQVENALLQVVAEKTGYPEDMLDLDMGLDADLGIDSIKRVEILSALQNQLPEAPEINSDQIGQIQNLRQIVDFLAKTSLTNQTQEIGDVQAVQDDVASDAELPESEPLERSIVVPVKLNQPDTRESISLTSGSTIWLSDDGTALTTAVERGLQQKGFEVQKILRDQISELEPPNELGGFVILAPPDEQIQTGFLPGVFSVLQLAGTGLKAQPSVCVTVSRLDGVFGFGSLNPATNPLSGGLAGLAKTAGREWPAVACKALDIASDVDNVDNVAEAILDEMFRVGPAEVGISANGRVALQLVQTPLDVGRVAGRFTSDDVIVITGGARGVTAECAVALAQASQSTLVLLGRSPAPVDEPQWMAGISKEAAMKKAIISNAGRKMTPKDVSRELRRILSNREIRQTIARIEAAGAKVAYRSVDVRNAEAVQQAIDDIQQQFGTITGLIHGAGVLADKKIEDKTADQFDRVYGTKVEGLLNMLAALKENPLKAMAFFSSTTARLGRLGQIDYAVANEVLNKTAQQQARLRPDCRVVSVNWGPWAGGMVTPVLERVFRHEGIGLIPLQAGAKHLVQELSLPSEGAPVEVIILGESPESQPYSFISTTAPHSSADRSSLSVAFERTLTIEEYPFLKSHVINGRAVLPMAVTIEWLAHAALHNNPGLVLHGFNDLRIFKGVTLQGHDSYSIQVLVGDAVKDGKVYLVPVEMHGTNTDGQDVLHARAEFILSSKLSSGERVIKELVTDTFEQQNGSIYEKYLFHGPDFHGIQQVEGCSAEGIIARTKSAPQPSNWIQQPLRNYWLTDPLMIDSGFQMMILWSFAQHQSGSLPTFVGQYRQFKPKFSPSGGRVVAKVMKHDPHRALATLEFLDPNGDLIARMENYECTIDPSLNQAFRQNSLTK